jgi:elongation factor G
MEVSKLVRPLEFKIEPKSREDQERLIPALQLLADADPSFGFSVDSETGEIILSGLSELQLDLKVENLLHDYGIAVNTSAPQVAYRETVLKRTECEYKHVKPRVGHIRLHFCVEPRPRNAGNLFEHEFENTHHVAEFLGEIEKGVRSVLGNGLLIGHPMMDVGVTLLGGDFNLAAMAESNVAARHALREACKNAGLAVLEPIMKVEIELPADFVGAVVSDLNRRRGKLLSQSMRGYATVLKAHVPLASMFGHAATLRRCQATATTKFDHYDYLPRNINSPDDFPPAVGMRA